MSSTVKRSLRASARAVFRRAPEQGRKAFLGRDLPQGDIVERNGDKSTGSGRPALPLMERRQQPMHVAGLQLFSLPPRAMENTSARWWNGCAPSTCPRGRFGADRHPSWTPLLGGRPQLTSSIIVRHFRRCRAPAAYRELLAFVSAEHSNPLHRERPLWEST